MHAPFQAPLRRPGAVLRSRSPGGPPKPWFYEAPAAEKQNVTFPYNKPSGAIRLKVRPLHPLFHDPEAAWSLFWHARRAYALAL